MCLDKGVVVGYSRLSHDLSVLLALEKLHLEI